MANPQAEKGHVDIALEIMNALCLIRIPGEPRQILDFIIRKTYGWHKKEDWISLNQFVEGTGLKKPNVIRATSTLLKMNLITRRDNVIQSDNGSVAIYGFQKDFDKWIPLPKQKPRGRALSDRIMTVIQSDKASLSDRIPTKENNTKENITKEKDILSSGSNLPQGPPDLGDLNPPPLLPPVLPSRPDEKDSAGAPARNNFHTEVVLYLNQRANRDFRPSNKKTKALIEARVKDGFTLDDFKRVIDNQVSRWLDDDKFAAYLRPITLFGTKFESYLQAGPKPKESSGARSRFEGDQVGGISQFVDGKLNPAYTRLKEQMEFDEERRKKSSCQPTE